MDPVTTKARRGATARLRSMMLAVLIVGLGLWAYRLVPENGVVNRGEGVMLVHALFLGIFVPLLTALGYLAYAAGQTDDAVREARTQQTVALGCVAWVFVLGSLAFWFIVLCIGPVK